LNTRFPTSERPTTIVDKILNMNWGFLSVEDYDSIVSPRTAINLENTKPYPWKDTESLESTFFLFFLKINFLKILN